MLNKIIADACFMITSIRVRNFKNLKNISRLEIKPITLLVGANSSGKTSVLQTLLLIKQTVENEYLISPLVLRGNLINLGSYKDIIFKHDVSKKLTIGLTFNIKEYQKIKSKRILLFYLKDLLKRWCDFKEFSFEFTVSYNVVKKNMQLSKNEIFDANKKYFDITITNKKIHGFFEKNKFEHKLSIQKTLYGDNIIIGLKQYPYRGLFFAVSAPYIIRPEIKDYPLNRLLRLLPYLMNLISDYFSENVYYIGPLRVYPQRFYIATGEHTKNVGSRGEHAVGILYVDFMIRKKLFLKLQDWLNKFEMAKKIELKQISEGLFSLILKDPFTGIDVSLADSCFGASQIIPIIIEGYNSNYGSTIIIEQPEIHLHPKAQAMLSDLFIDIAKTGKKKLIIETHSEHLLLRLQRRIAEGKISPNEIVIYFFENGRNGAEIKEVKLNQYGFIEDFPKGFFEEDINEIYSLIKAVAKTKKEEQHVKNNNS